LEIPWSPQGNHKGITRGSPGDLKRIEAGRKAFAGCRLTICNRIMVKCENGEMPDKNSIDKRTEIDEA
jgi:hypothetical protein